MTKSSLSTCEKSADLVSSHTSFSHLRLPTVAGKLTSCGFNLYLTRHMYSVTRACEYLTSTSSSDKRVYSFALKSITISSASAPLGSLQPHDRTTLSTARRPSIYKHIHVARLLFINPINPTKTELAFIRFCLVYQFQSDRISKKIAKNTQPTQDKQPINFHFHVISTASHVGAVQEE